MIPKVGQMASLTKTITAGDVERFAELVGDRNPVHLDDAAAKRTRFGRRIVHGIFGAALISAVLGTELPGPGTIYISQSLRFLAPAFVGDTLTATVTITGVRPDKPIATCDTVCRNQDGTTILKGEAVVLVEDLEQVPGGGPS